MRRHLSLALVVGLGLGVAAQADDAKVKEKLQGTWRPVSSVENGRESKEAEQFLLTFEKDTFTIKRGEEAFIKGTFKVDSSKKPMTIDMEIKESRQNDDNGKTSPGIIEIDGATLKWCAARPGSAERPTEFASLEGSRNMLVTFKREKK